MVHNVSSSIKNKVRSYARVQVTMVVLSQIIYSKINIDWWKIYCEIMTHLATSVSFVSVFHALTPATRTKSSFHFKSSHILSLGLIFSALPSKPRILKHCCLIRLLNNLHHISLNKTISEPPYSHCCQNSTRHKYCTLCFVRRCSLEVIVLPLIKLGPYATLGLEANISSFILSVLGPHCLYPASF